MQPDGTGFDFRCVVYSGASSLKKGCLSRKSSFWYHFSA